MLRYSVAAGERLVKLNKLDVHVGGAETNTLGALVCLGRRCGWVSALPENDLGAAVLRELAAARIDTGAVVRGGPRVGTYYVEFADAPRHINVLYDRAGSSVTQLRVSEVDWDYLLDTRVLYLTGITPALSEGCREIVVAAVRRAKAAGVPVVFDVNYRSKLWSPEQAAETLTAIVAEVDVLICGEGDAGTVFGAMGITEDILLTLQNLCPQGTVVLTQSGEGSATLGGDGLVRVAPLAAVVVDRLGAGDAYAAGVVDGFLDGDLYSGMQRGSVLSSVALSQHGDMLTTSRAEVEALGVNAPAAIHR